MNEKIDEELYLQASKEIEDGNTNEGTWARAFANSEGSEEKTKALYIKYRSKKLKEEKEEEEGGYESDDEDTDWSFFWFGVILTIVVLLLIFGGWKLLQLFGILS
tara:strand:+ start:270 stop:584 length:315 start_codon:yes stop_codon:yes gene_type:complete